MKIDQYKFLKSSFLAVEKNASLIIDRLLSSEDLKKMLFYPTKDCLTKPNLTQEQTLFLPNNHIVLTAKLPIDPDARSYIVINFDNFTTNSTNPEFRDSTIEFDIVCRFDDWSLNDFKIRPYRIAGEIDSLMNNTRLVGIGLVQFLSAGRVTWSGTHSGLTLGYGVTHGEEDKVNPLE